MNIRKARDNADRVKAGTKLVVEGTVGMPKKTWQNIISADMHLLRVDLRDTKALMKRRAIGRRKSL